MMAYRHMSIVWSEHISRECVIRCDKRKTLESDTQMHVDLASEAPPVFAQQAEQVMQLFETWTS